MRQYGAMFATEFSKKQINVIFANAKQGNLKVEKWIMKDFYALADFYGYDSNRSVANDESFIMSIIDAVFAKDYEKAQRTIDIYTQSSFDRYAPTKRNNLDRSLVA